MNRSLIEKYENDLLFMTIKSLYPQCSEQWLAEVLYEIDQKIANYLKEVQEKLVDVTEIE